MPEMRQDAVTKRWVVIATERAKRPERPDMHELEAELVEHDEDCFFCWGNEDTTPPEVYAVRLDGSKPDTPGWLLRVIENKYAALSLRENFNIKSINSLNNYSHATGKAEVIIETYHHSRAPSKQSLLETKRVLSAYRERFKALSKDDQLKYILIFRNCGAMAGASLEHPHSQVIAIPVVPANVNEELTGSLEYFKSNNECVYCTIIEHEKEEGSRIIYENDLFISFAPYASRTPFETWIMPKKHSLSELWRATFYKLDAGLNNPPYNCFIHTSPTQQNVDDYYHWHVEIIPKLTIAAGFELGAGMYINVTIPEECADFLRSIDDVY